MKIQDVVIPPGGPSGGTAAQGARLGSQTAPPFSDGDPGENAISILGPTSDERRKEMRSCQKKPKWTGTRHCILRGRQRTFPQTRALGATTALLMTKKYGGNRLGMVGQSCEMGYLPTQSVRTMLSH
eukprot:479039-Pyramimonas_sp.AAC.1